jgi:hypothetical protein
MKPRLRSADLTQEDWLAWLHARHGFHEIPWVTLIDAYEAADRRDADLVLKAQEWPAWSWVSMPHVSGWGVVQIRVRWHGSPIGAHR